MDSESMNHYEKQLYTVFKSFDVENEEALDKTAVKHLCDALQLEDRGAALVDTLFERRAGRVTFAQFRNGLLSVLGADSAPPAPPSDDESGAEVPPKLVVGAKRYGRRSRPQRAAAEPAARASSESRVTGAQRSRRFPRSASAMEPRADDIDHTRRVDCEQALRLCRDLNMDGIDPALIERIFDESPIDSLTVGDFFDKLNVALTSSMTTERAFELAHTSRNEVIEEGSSDEESSDTVLEALERGGVRCPRRLLVDLGFGGGAVRPAALQRAVDAELGALPAPAREPAGGRACLQAATVALAQLRRCRAHHRATRAAAERDKLRADLAEANRRAQEVAHDVDETQAQLEAELRRVRSSEARQAEAARVAASEFATERERAATEHARLSEELARHVENEGKLREEIVNLRTVLDETEKRATEAEEDASRSRREATRVASELRGLEARRGSGAEGEAERAELTARAERLVRELQRVRDENDELCAELEAERARGGRGGQPPDTHASWRDETHAEESLDLNGELSGDLFPAAAVTGAACLDVAVQTEEEEARTRLQRAEHTHRIEKEKLNALIGELEASLEQMRGEYDKCEEYWQSKLEDERAEAAEEQRAGDERLAELVGKIAEYERQYSSRALPPVAEAAELEAQHEQLQRELDALRASSDAQLRRRDDEIARLQRDTQLARRPVACTDYRRHLHEHFGAAAARSLRARAAAAERLAARLQARLATADLLVRDLYLENCQLASQPRTLL